MTAFWIPVIATRLQLRAKRGRGERCGNPERVVIARRRSRHGNPDGLNKMHLGLAGLLHFVRNDGIGDFCHCNKTSAASEARQRRAMRQSRTRRHCEKAEPTRQSRWFKQNAFLSCWIASLRSQ
jgi:hypothetical protein